MNILLLGGSGRTGSRIYAQLLARRVHGAPDASIARAGTATVRAPSSDELDLTRMAAPEAWRPWLQDTGVVIHAAGVLRVRGDDTFANHLAATRALCVAARGSGLRHIVRLSCAGADENSALPWFAAHGAMDAICNTAGLPATIVRSGVMYFDTGSGSTRRCHPYALTLDWHSATGRLPLTCIDDAVAAVVNAAFSSAPRRPVVRELTAPCLARAA